MTPNFALSLSFEGIRLLHRVTDGWHLVGEVAIDDPQLSDKMDNLRQIALAIDPQGLRCKLLLPNEQIKYLAIDTPRATDEEITDMLVGATPYAIDELTYDYTRGGGRTYVAAVAKETLTEAENFARDFKFNPRWTISLPSLQSVDASGTRCRPGQPNHASPGPASSRAEGCEQLLQCALRQVPPQHQAQTGGSLRHGGRPDRY